MNDNPTLQTIRDRRSVRNFSSAAVTDEQLEGILEAGRWAPSARNSQPWSFVIVRDAHDRAAIGEILKRNTYAWGGFATAPVMIVVSVDQSRDPEHFVEDGAVAAQNLCLAAQSLGLGSSWAGVYGERGRKGSAESALKNLLGLPRKHRVIAVVPIGTAKHASRTTRRPLAEMVHQDRFQSEQESPSRESAPAATESEDTSRRILTKARRRRSPEESGRFL
jgi:nitroreductase